MKKLRFLVSPLLALTATFLLVSACGKDSSKSKSVVGASCTPTETSCGEGLECTESASETGAFVCTLATGGPCDPNGALANSGCAATAECTTHGTEAALCTFRAGETCNPELDNGGCAELAVCVSPDTGSAQAVAGAAGAAGAPEEELLCLLAEGSQCEPSDNLCAPEFSCAEMASGGYRCFHPVVLRGAVSATSDNSAIGEAHIIALDSEGVAVTDVAISAESGAYELEIPVARNDDGSPVADPFRLAAGAQNYQPFPSGIRVALPIDASTAVAEASAYVIDNTLTALGLIPLPAGTRTMISGSISDAGDTSALLGGVLVVAAGASGAYSAVSDLSGDYTIFNVPAGSYEVRGYAANLSLSTADVSVGSTEVSDVALNALSDSTTSVTGNVQIVNAPGGSLTSVILVVEDTFNATAATGEVPRGLRAPNSGAPDVAGDFLIEGVPEGRYVVLAAYENDDLVRDPDTNISGTSFVYLDVVAGEATEVPIPESFKVTEALEIFGPGAEGPEGVDEAPVLRWADDSSEDWYDVRVFDALGNEVWTSLELPGVSGQDEVSVQYDGPLDAGMYYQFRVSSWRQPGNGDPAPISTTEDLRGVFYLPAQ